MTTIEQELHEAVEFDTQKGEKRQDYLRRLIGAIDELEDDAFEKLSKGAQLWAESASQAVLNQRQIPDFESDEEEDEAETETEEAEEAYEEANGGNGAKPVKKSKKVVKGKGEAKKAATKEKKVKSDQGRVARPRGSLPTGRNKYVQDVLAKNPNATVDEIAKVLERKGVEVPSRISISTSRSSFRSALETMNRHDMLKVPVDLKGER